MGTKLEKIKKAILKKPYVFYFFLVFFAYLGSNIWINETFVTFSTLFTYRLGFVIPFVIFNIITAFLVALNVNLVIIKFKDFRKINRSGGVTAIGIFLGFLGGACPGCFAGVLPAIVGIFGSTFTLNQLPLLGLEIQIASALILILSAYLLTRNKVCKVNFDKK